MAFEIRPLPPYLGLSNTIFRRVGFPELTPEHLLRRAARKAGLPERFPAHVGDALEVLCRSYRDEANLHWFGKMNQYNLLMTGLVSLLRVEQAFADDPTLADTPLRPPLVVTGLPRSGTTFLHRLLSVPGDAAGVRLFEHVYPVPHRPFDWRRLDVKLMFAPWQLASGTYELDAMHFVRPDMPDECNFGMRISGRSMIYASMSPTPSYLKWLLDQDLRESYLLYRKVLILLQRQHPGKRLVLKCPHHLAWLPALVEALPEAHIVQTHRDPRQSVPSECKLVTSLHALATDTLDWRRSVEHNRLKVRTFANRAVEFSRLPEGKRILHLDYRELVADPTRLSRHVHQHFGLAWNEAIEADTARFIGSNPQHKHGKNRYGMEQFELDPAEVDREYTTYIEHFLPDLADARAGRAEAR